ncbi:rhomboid family intramembrane serine protease [Arenicella xantha]|uniref:Rhomboid family protein n=1 Tax=Arenicella xantha TaxID=644221 RepID=A0A395JTX4_9GAMM|nr:rhomboid family intramembrane serine protease [Arenicella xantha]RBP53048.1 rhomboid family protein [Arenicella xantha]
MIVVPVEKRIDWKRPPVVLIGLVLINILVFAFYQSSDMERAEEAVVLYHELNLQQLELSAFRSYMRKRDPAYQLDQEDETVIWQMASDPGFAEFLDEHYKRYIPLKDRGKWERFRAEVNKIAGTISSRILGLNPNDIGIVTLFSHQFLHGSVDHLIGNMVFLLLTGFAVEAALGSKRFLLFYLISGVGAGLLFSVVEMASGGHSASLIGASGSISGVMAMYVVLFGMRKIEFFYWLFIFTGYFRAAAIIMLPAYIVKELIMQFSGDASNVAYLAHVGGFIAGAALVYATRSVQHDAIDDRYLDNAEEAVDPYLAGLQSVYNELGRCEFKRAYALLRPLKQKRPHDPELIDIEFNIVKALNGAKAHEYLLRRLGQNGNSHRIVAAQLQRWNRMSLKDKSHLSFEQKADLLIAALELGREDISEVIYQELSQDEERSLELATLSRRMASCFQALGQHNKSEQFDRQARDLMSPQYGSQGGAA